MNTTEIIKKMDSLTERCASLEINRRELKVYMAEAIRRVRDVHETLIIIKSQNDSLQRMNATSIIRGDQPFPSSNLFTGCVRLPITPISLPQSMSPYERKYCYYPHTDVLRVPVSSSPPISLAATATDVTPMQQHPLPSVGTSNVNTEPVTPKISLPQSMSPYVRKYCYPQIRALTATDATPMQQHPLPSVGTSNVNTEPVNPNYGTLLSPQSKLSVTGCEVSAADLEMKTVPHIAVNNISSSSANTPVAFMPGNIKQPFTTDIRPEFKRDSTEKIVNNLASFTTEASKTAPINLKSVSISDTKTSSSAPSIKIENSDFTTGGTSSKFVFGSSVSRIGDGFSLNAQKSIFPQTSTVSTAPLILQKADDQTDEKTSAYSYLRQLLKIKADEDLATVTLGDCVRAELKNFASNNDILDGNSSGSNFGKVFGNNDAMKISGANIGAVASIFEPKFEYPTLSNKSLGIPTNKTTAQQSAAVFSFSSSSSANDSISFRTDTTTITRGNSDNATSSPNFSNNTFGVTSTFGSGAKSESPIFSNTTTITTSSNSKVNIADNGTSNNKLPGFLFSAKNSDVSFATLASKESNAFKPATSDFSWPGAGTSVFKTVVTSPNTKSDDRKNNEENDEANTSVGEEYDPHYDPIIPLPDIVEVKTGEEDEEIVFSSRAKLYRRDNNKEWKERGVGDIKILHNSLNGTYRLLMRREQVFKIVLNQRLADNFTLEKMSTSASSWCWIGMNMPEEHSEPVMETLAVRFKTEELATEFGHKVDTCVAEIESNK